MIMNDALVVRANKYFISIRTLMVLGIAPSILKTFRYSICMRLSVVEGVRNMYYEYAHSKAETIASLKEEMYYSSNDSDD